MKSEQEIREKINQLQAKRERAKEVGLHQVARDHKGAIIYLRWVLGEMPEEYDP